MIPIADAIEAQRRLLGDRAVGRFAPSPSGRMHLGNIYAALLSWLFCKAGGGRWILRIEDLDPGRSRYEHARWIEDDLHWLGLDWDEGGLDDRGPHGPYSQSRRGEIYQEHFDRLRERRLVYPCWCTRADLMASSAPHQSDGIVLYPGTCRPVPGKTVRPREGRNPAWRIALPDERITFDDAVYGPCSFNLAIDSGDFILRRSDGAWAYQLAVTVDDALMGVNQVVRGADLLSSSARQIFLYRQLGYTTPAFAHLPLLCNEQGQRLSKRDAAESMQSLRRIHTPEELIGRIAQMLRLQSTPTPVSAADLLNSLHR